MKMQSDSLNDALATAKATLALALEEVAKARDNLVAKHREVQVAAHQLARLEKQEEPYTTRVVETIPDKQSALTNLVYVNEMDDIARYAFIEAGEYVFTVCIHPLIFAGCLGLGNLQRKLLIVAVRDEINFKPYFPKSVPDLTMINIEIANFDYNNLIECELDADELIACLIRVFNGQIFTKSQIVAFEHNRIIYQFTVSNLIVNVVGESQEASRGLLRGNTAFTFTNTDQNPIKIKGSN